MFIGFPDITLARDVISTSLFRCVGGSTCEDWRCYWELEVPNSCRNCQFIEPNNYQCNIKLWKFNSHFVKQAWGCGVRWYTGVNSERFPPISYHHRPTICILASSPILCLAIILRKKSNEVTFVAIVKLKCGTKRILELLHSCLWSKAHASSCVRYVKV